MFIYRASDFFRLQCVDLLLSLGADPNIAAKNGLLPLHEAASSADITRSLLGAGADLPVGNASLVFTAILEQNLEVLTSILDAGDDVNAITDDMTIDPSITDQARTALFCASFSLNLNHNIKNSVSQIKLLINRGADIYAPLNDRETLIHYVLEHGQYESLCAYLDCHNKINFEARDQLGRTILLAACNWTEVAPGYHHKHWDAKEPAPVIRLLEYGADIMAVSNDGRNVLHHLLDNPDIEQDTIIQVIEKEPEACKKMLNHRDNEGYTPFHSALHVLRPEICFKLLDWGADLLDPDPSGATALHHIASQYLQQHRPACGHRLPDNYPDGHHEKARELWGRYLTLGSSINVRDRTGSPPLFTYLSSPHNISCRTPHPCCHLESFPALFDAKDLDITAKNNAGETALHIIAQRSKYTITPEHDKHLVEFIVKDVDPLTEDKDGMTALDVAAARGKTDILSCFRGADGN